MSPLTGSFTILSYLLFSLLRVRMTYDTAGSMVLKVMHFHGYQILVNLIVLKICRNFVVHCEF